MQLIKWQPRNDIFGFPHHLNHFFDDFFYPKRNNPDREKTWFWNPVVDVYEEQDNFVIKAELPGVSKDGITVDVKDRILTIKGERSADNEVQKDRYFHRERVYGRFERTFNLPADVDPDAVKAQYIDGVLKVTVPKPETRKPKQITVH